MPSAAQNELATQINALAASGVTAGCAAISAKLGPTAGEVCNTLGKSANDIFAAFSVIEDKTRELAGAKAADKLAAELSGQWGSITQDVTKDLAVCKYNDNTGTCGGRIAARVAKAFLKIRPLNAGDSQPGTLPKMGQVTPVLIPYAKAVLYAAFGNTARANKEWTVYTKNLAAYTGQNSDALKLKGVEDDITEVATELQKKWTASGWEKLKALKAQQAALKKKLGQPAPADLGEIFAPKVTEEALQRVKRAAEKRKAAEQEAQAAEEAGTPSPAVIAAAAAVVGLIALGRK